MPDHSDSVTHKFTVVDKVDAEDSTLTSFKRNQPRT
jgi:hypothetical protein